MDATIISYPLNEINETIDIPNTYVSTSMIQNLWINVSDAPTDSYIEVTYNDVVKRLIITEECRYTPVDVGFINKHGALEIITFFKAKKETVSIESESYEGNNIIGKHQFNKYNVKAKVKFTANTGFLTEDKNENIKQLLLSERAWQIDGSLAIPLNVGTTQQEIKTRQNDRLINYAIEFEHAYYENNLV